MSNYERDRVVKAMRSRAESRPEGQPTMEEIRAERRDEEYREYEKKRREDERGALMWCVRYELSNLRSTAYSLSREEDHLQEAVIRYGKWDVVKRKAAQQKLAEIKSEISEVGISNEYLDKEFAEIIFGDKDLIFEQLEEAIGGPEYEREKVYLKKDLEEYIAGRGELTYKELKERAEQSIDLERKREKEHMNKDPGYTPGGEHMITREMERRSENLGYRPGISSSPDEWRDATRPTPMENDESKTSYTNPHQPAGNRGSDYIRARGEEAFHSSAGPMDPPRFESSVMRDKYLGNQNAWEQQKVEDQNASIMLPLLQKSSPQHGPILRPPPEKSNPRNGPIIRLPPVNRLHGEDTGGNRGVNSSTGNIELPTRPRYPDTRPVSFPLDHEYPIRERSPNSGSPGPSQQKQNTQPVDFVGGHQRPHTADFSTTNVSLTSLL